MRGGEPHAAVKLCMADGSAGASQPHAGHAFRRRAHSLLVDRPLPCRYSGLIAWRGVVDAAQQPQVYEDMRAAYARLGHGIIFDLAARQGRGEMALTYMIPGPRINWLWWAPAPLGASAQGSRGGVLVSCTSCSGAACQTSMQGCRRPRPLVSCLADSQRLGSAATLLLLPQPHQLLPACRYRQAPEPQLPGHSVTIKPDAQLLQGLHKEAQSTWTGPLARLMQAPPPLRHV